MTLLEDVTSLKNHIDAIGSIYQLRTFLFEKDLKLVVILISDRFSCVEWNIAEEKSSKVLDWGLRIRISKRSDETQSFETAECVPIRVKEPSWKGLDDFFDILKQGIQTSLKNAS